jgi:hypothetical protein
MDCRSPLQELTPCKDRRRHCNRCNHRNSRSRRNNNRNLSHNSHLLRED